MEYCLEGGAEFLFAGCFRGGDACGELGGGLLLGGGAVVEEEAEEAVEEGHFEGEVEVRCWFGLGHDGVVVVG